MLVDFVPDAVSTAMKRGDCRCTGTGKRIKHRVADKTEHANQTLGKGFRIRRGMLPCGRSRKPGPYLGKPCFVAFDWNYAQQSSRIGGTAVATWLALHQDELDVVLDYGIRLVGLAEKSAAAIVHLMHDVGNLVPNDRRQIVEADGSTVFLDRGMQRNHGMPSVVFSAGQTDVADDTNQPAAGNEYVKASPPCPASPETGIFRWLG